MRLNLRYVIPMMCGTCIALTVSVAAAVSGTLDNEKEISLLPAASETESRVYHSNGFTAPTAYSGGSIAEVGTDLAETETAEIPQSDEITAESAQTSESADITAEPTESFESAQNAESSEVPIKTNEQTEEPLYQSDRQSAEAIPETDKHSIDVLPEENAQTAEAASEANEPTKEVPAETDKPAEETQNEAVSTGYDEPHRQAMLEAVNAVRAEYGLTALSEMPELSEIAQQRARECASHFSHTRPNGTKWHTLLNEAGLKRSVRAENIAYYYPTAQQALNSWMDDYSHKVNILNAEAVYIGIGYYNDGYNSYWVQIFLGE